MSQLDGVGHGTTLSGRYRLEERLAASADSASWRAVDQNLGRPVAVRVLSAGHPHREEVVDAARRAAVLDDPRLLRVLDVGADEDGTVFVISELAEGENLARALARGPVPADVVRAVAGEAAGALELARLRGLHHLRLEPSSVVLTGHGGVRVAGLAVEAAVAGVEPQDAAAASRQDTQALVALLYAGLTGRWPLGQVAGMPAAPLVGGTPVPPGDLVAGVPNDLDTVCSTVLGPHPDGPRTPGELSEQLAPWRSLGGELMGEGVLRGAPAAVAADIATGTARLATSLAPGPAPGAQPAGDAGQVAPAVQARWSRVGPAGASAASPSSPLSENTSPVLDLYGDAGDMDQREDSDAQDTAGPADGRVRGHERLVLAVVAAVVVVALLLALNSIRGLGDALSGPQEPVSVTEPAASAPEPQPEPEPDPEPEPPAESPEPAPAPPVVPVPVGALPLDPEGDGEEKNELASLAIDGDPATSWASDTYRSAEFGNLKPGLGLAVDLGGPATVSGVTLTAPGTGGAFELRTAPGPGLDGSQVVATGEISGGPVDIALPEPVQTPYLVLWVTRLPEVEGDFRIEVAEIVPR